MLTLPQLFLPVLAFMLFFAGLMCLYFLQKHGLAFAMGFNSMASLAIEKLELSSMNFWLTAMGLLLVAIILLLGCHRFLWKKSER